MNIVITPPTGHTNISPIGFHGYASQFADSALSARSRLANGFSPVPYFLYCRSLELVLKAYLLARGVTKAELKRKFRHDLCRVFTEAKNRGLAVEVPISSEWEAEIGKANLYYNGKGFEYFEVGNAVRGYPNLPSLDTLAQMCSTLLRGVAQTCLNA